MTKGMPGDQEIVHQHGLLGRLRSSLRSVLRLVALATLALTLGSFPGTSSAQTANSATTSPSAASSFPTNSAGSAVPVVNAEVSSGTAAESSNRTGASPVEIGAELQLGWAGKYKLGQWTPVTVAVTNPGESQAVVLEWTTSDVLGVPAEVRYPRESLAAGEKRRWQGWVKLGRTGARLQLRIWSAEPGERVGELLGERTWTRSELPAPLEQREQLVGSLGSWPVLRETIERRSVLGRDRLALAELAAAADVPSSPESFQSLDLLVLSAAKLADGSSAMTVEQWEAVRDWVRLGGRLLIYGAEKFVQAPPANHPLNELLPGRWERVTAQRQTTMLESFVGGGVEPLSSDQFQEPGALSFSLPAVVLSGLRGPVLVTEGSGSNRHDLIVQHAVGLGEVLFVGLDLDEFPFTKWSATPRLLDRLLDASLGSANEEIDETNQRLGHAGYDDLMGQLQVALDRFAGVSATSFSWVATLIAGYILLIGPVDYWLWRRLGRRFEGTWFTFPLTVICVSMLAGWVLQRSKGEAGHLNQIDIVDWDLSHGTMRGTSWYQIYSPNNSRWDLAAGAPGPVLRDALGAADPPSLGAASASLDNSSSAESTVWLSWLGGAEGAVAGGRQEGMTWGVPLDYRLRLRATSSGVWQSRIDDLPLEIATSRALINRWWRDVKPRDWGSLTADIDNKISGSLRNPFGVALKRCWLIHGKWVYELAQLSPDGVWAITSQMDPKNLNYLLTLRRHINGKDRTTRWDPESSDLQRILQMMMFHAAAGGDYYTAGLVSREQADLDLSGLVELDRAILVGWAEGGATELQRDGETLTADSSWTVLRAVLPVQRTPRP